jgi:hypothetical protein
MVCIDTFVDDFEESPQLLAMRKIAAAKAATFAFFIIPAE